MPGNALRYLTSLCAALLLGGCMALNTPEEASTFWELRMNNPPAANSPAAAGGLIVARVRAEANLDTTAMLYREADYEPRYYARSRWIDRPTRQLQTALIDGLEAAGTADVILRAPTQLSARYRLETELLALEHDYRGNTPHAVLRLRVQVLDQDQRSVLASRVISLREPMTASGPGAGVEAGNRALDEAIERIRTVIVQALADAE
ncbi:cholesterol transport system auxiliary component [Natronocella acetinitrilica]|uniref:Cholesterol transport system auxiliary component n=1 Tax=Natronocella acetinitrilica TaxID=414046 RepID=A0AAE3G5Q7_9GAMM|nr:ABC-type transport auxiliary lipoprotein family protein [Natronocella acetinitrilica]MCP1675524.1 cholesterol transport system auxiliary component [Natronocella acetinitrilica]